MINQNIGYVIIETATTSQEYKPTVVYQNNRYAVAECILQEANETNRNKRFYASEELFPQLTSPRTVELLTRGELRAENGHPLSKDIVRQSQIDPNNTVAIFLKLWADDNFVKAHVRGTNNAKGEEFNRDLLDGFKPAWSLRALGSIQNTQRGAEVKGLKVITWDRVIYPSHPRAYTQGLVTEGCSGVLEQKDPGMLIPITNESVIDYIKTESANYKNILETFELEYDNIELIRNGLQVKLTGNDGSIYVVNTESYIQREIQDACFKLKEMK
ncbi:MAG: hypothetical protein PHC62_00410 [Candidatus Izemoplasmatales bacterium]|nr:hypothetical protein [Candidatus Izemoplasmatales bacterium]